MTPRLTLIAIALLAAGCASATSNAVDAAPALHAQSPVDATSNTGAPVPAAPPALAQDTPEPVSEPQALTPAPAPAPAPATQEPTPAPAPVEAPAKKSTTKLYPGTDQLFKTQTGPAKDPVLTSGDRVSLNFDNVSVSALASALLGDLLKLNYTIDAGGDVSVSLHTRQPLPRGQVLDVLDTVLLPHDLAIVRDSVGVYHLTKRSATAGARPVVASAKFKDLAGSGTVIVPLNYVAAAEMAKILAPLAPRESIVYVDSLRNLIILQGSKAQLSGWLDMVEAFDVDFLAGMSLGVFVLENANVNIIRDTLQTMLSGVPGAGDNAADPFAGKPATPPQPPMGASPAASAAGAGATAQSAQAALATAGAGANNPLHGLIRIFPVERLNALVVVTPRSHLLAQVETWIRRLDRPTDNLEPQLFVYPVQNGSARHMAEMLNGIFGASNTGNAGIAPGAAPSQFTTAARAPAALGGANALAGSAGTAATMGSNALPTTANSSMLPGPVNSAQVNLAPPLPVQLEGNIRVVADPKRNALLIRAPRAEYRRIEQALRELDTAPAQVLIEASIVEVSLTGNLKYGVEWFIENSMSRDRTGQALLNYNGSGSIGAPQPGFTYTLFNKAGAVRATLNALAANAQLRVLSSPSILVLDNHSATIMVGKQQPIKQSTTVTTGNLITESITYKDTGVMLSVTPSVNAGGLVTLDINQQVTDVGEIDAATSQRNFLTRQIQSRVAVRSGDPIVLGGVMSENQSTGNSGVPGLRNLPLLGALFSTDTTTSARTELLVVLTPRVLEDDDALRAASAEMRDRMRNLSLQTPLQTVPATAAPAALQIKP